jgi:curved DNA-binding protein CbpA
MNYYELLGVPYDADAAAIRRAYRRLARRYRPDAGADSSAARFRAVAQAYETLASSARRRSYDLSLSGPAVGSATGKAPHVRCHTRIEPITVPRRPAEPLCAFDQLLEEIFRSIEGEFFRW